MIQLHLPLENCNHQWYLPLQGDVICGVCNVKREVRRPFTFTSSDYQGTCKEILAKYRKDIGLTT
jgi:hypothetical protein